MGPPTSLSKVIGLPGINSLCNIDVVEGYDIAFRSIMGYNH